MIKIQYQHFLWSIIILLTSFTILDRFVWNLWSMGIDNPAFKGTWTVVFFDICARVSGRLILVSTNVLFYTQCKVCANFLMDHHPKWLFIGDINQIHNSIHIWTGKWLMGLPILIHVWSIFLPFVFGINLVVMEERPEGLPFFHNNTVNLVYNDIYRLILMTILFCFLFPLSLSRFGKIRSYTITSFIHIFAALMFTIDLLRMPSHPHAHVFNTPVVFMWIIDKILGIYFYRNGDGIISKKIRLDKDYMILLLNIPNYTRKFGDCYWLNLKQLKTQLSHPFTTFNNYGKEMIHQMENYEELSNINHKFYLERNEDSKDEFQRQNTISVSSEKINKKWNIGILMKVYQKKKSNCWISPGWTQYVSTENVQENDNLQYYGPYRSDYSNLNNIDELPPLILSSSGAGVSYILDFYNYIISNDIELKNRVDIYFTCRSISLFQFITDILCKKQIHNFHVNAHITSKDDEVKYNPSEKDIESDRKMAIGRVSFDEIIKDCSNNTEVYFCGSPFLQQKISKFCSKYSIKLRKGHSF